MKKLNIKNSNFEIDNLNYHIFTLVLFFSCILFFDYPDTESSVGWLGQRSIITHSILLPYLVLHFKLMEDSIIASIVVVGLFLGMGIHLSADLHPMEWNGSTLIKFPGDISIGGLSPAWILINAVASLYLASKLMMQITYSKKFLYTYLTIGLIIGSLYELDNRHAEVAKLLTFVAIFLITFFMQKKKLRAAILDKEKKIKENKIFFRGDFWTYLMRTIIIIPGILIGIFLFISLFL